MKFINLFPEIKQHVQDVKEAKLDICSLLMNFFNFRFFVTIQIIEVRMLKFNNVQRNIFVWAKFVIQLF